MALDNRGIHRYTEADSAATFSDLLNIGMTSVSNRIAYFADTAAKRAALAPAPPGAMWQDTDGDKRLWSASPTGAWRLHEGIATSPAASWQIGGVSGAVTMYARTVTLDIPTVLAPDETVMVTLAPSATAYTFVSLATHTRRADRTTLTLRHMIVGAPTQVPCTIAWRIIKGGI